MKNLLFPHKYRLWGWCLAIPAFIFSLVAIFELIPIPNIYVPLSGIWQKIYGNTSFSSDSLEITDEIYTVFLLLGLFLVAFSSEKKEDEMMEKLRLDALQWSVYANYITLLLAVIFVHGTTFLLVMYYNFFTVLWVFILRYNYLKSRLL